jgi:hypothetical protein
LNNAPFIPQLISPSNGTTLNITAVLNWTSGDLDGDLIKYDLVIDDNQDFSSPVVEKTLTDSIYSTVSDSLANKVYYWKVRADDNFTTSNYSSVGSFSLSMTIVPTCTDGIQNQGETGVDCGGSCSACQSSSGGGGGGGSGGGGGGGSSSSGGSTTTSSVITTKTNTTTTQNKTTQTCVINGICELGETTENCPSDCLNNTIEQNKTTEKTKPTGFAVLTPANIVVSALFIGACVGAYFVFNHGQPQDNNYRWKQRWKR